MPWTWVVIVTPIRAVCAWVRLTAAARVTGWLVVGSHVLRAAADGEHGAAGTSENP